MPRRDSLMYSACPPSFVFTTIAVLPLRPTASAPRANETYRLEKPQPLDLCAPTLTESREDRIRRHRLHLC